MRRNVVLAVAGIHAWSCSWEPCKKQPPLALRWKLLKRNLYCGTVSDYAFLFALASESVEEILKCISLSVRKLFNSALQQGCSSHRVFRSKFLSWTKFWALLRVKRNPEKCDSLLNDSNKQRSHFTKPSKDSNPVNQLLDGTYKETGITMWFTIIGYFFNLNSQI